MCMCLWAVDTGLWALCTGRLAKGQRATIADGIAVAAFACAQRCGPKREGTMPQSTVHTQCACRTMVGKMGGLAQFGVTLTHIGSS